MNTAGGDLSMAVKLSGVANQLQAAEVSSQRQTMS